MDVYEAIEKRRTIRVSERGYGRAVAENHPAGSKAPSEEPSTWEFIVVDDPRSSIRFAELKYQLNRKFTPEERETQKEVEERALKQKTGFQNASAVAVCNDKGQSVTAGWQLKTLSLAAVARVGSNIISYWEAARKIAEKILVSRRVELTCV